MGIETRDSKKKTAEKAVIRRTPMGIETRGNFRISERYEPFEEPQWGLKLDLLVRDRDFIGFEEPQWGLKQKKDCK